MSDDLLITGADEIAIRQDLTLVALGKRPADRTLRVGRLLDVHTRTWLTDQEIVFKGHRIAWVGPAGAYTGEVGERFREQEGHDAVVNGPRGGLDDFLKEIVRPLDLVPE